MRKRMKTKASRRLLSLALSGAMVLSLLPVFAFAEERDGLCQHHPAHTPECGYVAAVEGQDCAHVCGDDCYSLTTACTHVHGAECYGDGVLPAEGEEKTADACTHICSEESGCVTKIPACVHTAHDEACGYAPAVEGQPCGFVCTECAEAESEPDQPEEKVITDWEWVDEWEIIDPDSGNAVLPFASAENVARYDDILELLPAAIALNGEELTLGDWVCPDFPVETGAYEGAYIFRTILPEGFVLPDGSNVLRLTVVLGEPEGAPAAVLAITPAEPPKGTHIINGTSYSGVYELSTPGHLYWFANEVTNNKNASINAIVMNDITVNSGVLNADGSLNTSGSFESWTPIGNANAFYSGTFDGNGKTISGLYVNAESTSLIGLFGVIDSGGTVVNVKIADSYFAGKDNVGGVCSVNKGTVRGCYSSGTVIGSGNKTGGVCGTNDGGTVSSCYSSGTVTGSGDYVGGVCGYNVNHGTVSNCNGSGTVTGSKYVGGVCGYNANYDTVSNCTNSGTVTGSEYVGGVCGENNYGTVSGCTNSGSVNGSGDYIGGVYGYNVNNGTVRNCANSGTVIGNSYTGGVCGFNEKGTVSGCTNSGTVTGSGGYVGGVCGSNLSTISSCANSGAVTGNIRTGGVCGNNGSGTMSSCYSIGTVTGKEDVGGVCGSNGSRSRLSRCYYDNTAYTGNAVGSNASGTVEDVVGKSPMEFAGGEVAYLLNGSRSEGTQEDPLVWYQNIDLTGVTRDAYPKFTGATVYKTSDDSPCQGYSNYKNCVREHLLQNHACTYCGYWEPVPVTVSGITARDKTYDGNPTAELVFTNARLAGVLSAYPNVTVTATGTFADAGVGQDKPVTISGLTLTGADASRYYLADSGHQTGATASITPKEVTIQGAAVEATKVYDDSTTARITSDGTLSANYDGSNLTIVPGSAAYDTKNVGEDKTVTFSGFSLGGSAAGNYTLTAQPASTTASITAKSVTLTVTVKEKTFDDSTTAEIDTVTPNGIVSGDDARVVNGTPSFTRKTPGEQVPVSFTEFALEGMDAGNYQLTQPTGVTGRILASDRYLELTGDEFAGQTEVWVDGVSCPIQSEDVRFVNLPEEGGLLTIYTYQQEDSSLSHENYPTGMAVYTIDQQETGATAARIDALDNLLQYAGCSIRVTGKRGIRMITALTKDNKKALTRGGLAGYTLAEYGTVVQWADTLGAQSLTLDTGKHNYAYSKANRKDPVFATTDTLTQYTNVLVWDSLTNEQLGQDIVMRPYIILKDGSGNPVTLYGGTVSRSIGYIAYQNRAVFDPGTDAYQYVWEIIHAVYGDQYDSEYQG